MMDSITYFAVEWLIIPPAGFLTASQEHTLRGFLCALANFPPCAFKATINIFVLEFQ